MPDDSESSPARRNLQRDLRELEYGFRSQQLFLEHIEIRFGRLLKLLAPLAPAWQAAEDRRELLETELESSAQEVGFLQRELQTLERILARQESRRDTRVQGRLQELEQRFISLDAGLDGSRQRLAALEAEAAELLEQAHERRSEAGLLQESLELRRESRLLQDENRHLSAALAAFEETEQEYLRLLELKDKQLHELSRLYEFELEQQAEELSRTSLDQQSRQQQTQSLGRSLARLAQERNAGQLQQQNLLERLDALEADNRRLQAALTQAERDRETLESLEAQLEDKLGQHVPLEVLSYCHFYESAQGLGLELPETLYAQLAEALRLPEAERGLIESRLRLQPGRLQQVLADWSRRHPDALSRRSLPAGSPAETSPLSGLVRVPAGSYPLGDDLHPAERPAHRYHSEGFAIARLPVTNADYARFMGAGGYDNPDWWLPEGWNLIQAEGLRAPSFWLKRGYACGPDYPDYPVIGVSWYEAVAYATWAGRRLPSEAEWEAAGRGPDGLRWPWGDEWREGLANTAEAGINNTTPVGVFPEGVSPFGCLDLVGNVFEWTLSAYQPYPYAADDGREDLRTPGPRTLRGCSWNHRGHYFTRLSYRFQADPTTRHSDIGFRVAN